MQQMTLANDIIKFPDTKTCSGLMGHENKKN